MKKKVVVLCVFVGVIMIMCCNVFAATVVAPQKTGQNKTKWCWATSARIVGEHNGGVVLSHSAVRLTNTDGLHTYGGVQYYGTDSSGYSTANGAQRAIVVAIKGSDGNNTGSHTNILDALQLASSSTMTTGLIGTPYIEFSEANMTIIRNDLGDDNYLVGNLVATGFGAHSVAIAQYRSTDQKYRIIDPWDQTNMYYSYSTAFGSTGFPVAGYRGPITWAQYCR